MEHRWPGAYGDRRSHSVVAAPDQANAATERHRQGVVVKLLADARGWVRLSSPRGAEQAYQDLAGTAIPADFDWFEYREREYVSDVSRPEIS